MKVSCIAWNGDRNRTILPLGQGPLLAGFLLAGLLLAGCGSGDRPLSTVDPESVPANPTYEQVAAVLDRACVPCHHSSGAPGLAPAAFAEEDEDDDARPYDTCEGIVGGIDGILRTAVDDGSMPPGAWPRLPEEERLLIVRWVEQGACAPCNPCP